MYCVFCHSGVARQLGLFSVNCPPSPCSGPSKCLSLGPWAMYKPCNNARIEAIVPFAPIISLYLKFGLLWHAQQVISQTLESHHNLSRCVQLATGLRTGAD